MSVHRTKNPIRKHVRSLFRSAVLAAWQFEPRWSSDEADENFKSAADQIAEFRTSIHAELDRAMDRIFR